VPLSFVVVACSLVVISCARGALFRAEGEVYVAGILSIVQSMSIPHDGNMEFRSFFSPELVQQFDWQKN
jgi:hypothetical protein